jgi:N-acetylated-alpha-linked acidic dipeptidase
LRRIVIVVALVLLVPPTAGRPAATERAFRHEAGLPRREWFTHLAYAPRLYTGYGVKTLPGIREGIEQEQWDEARSFVPIVADAFRKLTSDVDRATGMLKKIVR